MKVSIIIPLHNRKDLICYTLDSLKSDWHNGIDLEVIVVDDGSQDGAFELVGDQYPWVRLYKNPGKGAPSARNFGLSMTSHDFVHFLDSDDLVAKGFYTDRVKALEQDSALGAVYGPWLTFKGMGNYDQQQLIPAHRAYPLMPKEQSMEHMAHLLKGWYLHPSSIIFRKSTVQELSGFEETLVVNQDVDLLFRFLVNKHTLKGTETPPSLVRTHDLNRVGVVSGDIGKMRTMLELRKKFVKVLENNRLMTDTYKHALGEFCIYRFAEYYTKDKTVAQQFYELGNMLYPHYELKGGLWIRLIAKVLGNKNAIIFKKKISKS